LLLALDAAHQTDRAVHTIVHWAWLTNIVRIDLITCATLNAKRRVSTVKTFTATRGADSILGKEASSTFVTVIIIIRVDCAVDAIRNKLGTVQADSI
jgi:hypothetical protein